jgi:autotransporter-associated beta strand protein
MRKSRLALNSAAVFGASLCWLPNVSGQATVSYPSPLDGAVIYTADSNPNRPNGSGGQWGNYYDLISSVVITTGYEDIQANSTTVPANAVTAPAIFFQINVNPGTVANPTDITSNAQWWCDYDLAMETSPGAGYVASSPSAVSNYYGKAVGISTGENYFINGFNNKVTAPSTTGGNEVYNYASGGWSQVAGVGQSNYVATTTTITTTSITYGIPLSDLGLSVGNTFTFDAYTSYGGLPYDALDNSAFAPTGYNPYSGASTYYDSATEPGSALSTYTVAAPTLTWNNTSAAVGYTDGRTWDTNDTNNYNWNNGLFADYYVDGSNVIFNDANNAVSNGGTNSNAYSVTLNTTVAPASVLVSNSQGNYTISGTGKIVDAGSFTKSGTGTLILGTALTVTGSTSITGGLLQLATGVSGGTGPAVTSAINLTSLSIAPGSALDLNNNHIIITYTSSDPISTIAGYLAAGYNNGAWNGLGGIDTSAPLTVNGLKYGLGYADSADRGNPAGLSSGTIEVAYTLLGDANLDGTVNGEDFTILASNFNQSVTSWDQGDFNYDGTVNGEDFTLLAANFNQQVNGAASAGDVAALDAFAAANGISLPTSVPEPASAALMVMAGLGILRRRRRFSR